MRHGIAELAGWLLGRASGLLLFAGIVSSAGGCFTLGGRTTYVQASPETEARIRGLETRVGALEQAVTTRAATSPLHESGLPIIGQANSPPSYESADQTDRDAAVR